MGAEWRQEPLIHMSQERRSKRSPLLKRVMSNLLIKHWIGQHVTVTLRAAIPTKIMGIVAEADEVSLVLEQTNKLRMLIPFSSVLHIEEVGGAP